MAGLTEAQRKEYRVWRKGSKGKPAPSAAEQKKKYGAPHTRRCNLPRHPTAMDQDLVRVNELVVICRVSEHPGAGKHWVEGQHFAPLVECDGLLTQAPCSNRHGYGR